MPILDFREISTAAHGASRDQFELFAREFLGFMGLEVLVGPDRGPDARRDLIVQERRTGVLGETQVRWLVSCKHKAHSGASISPDDEADIKDRLEMHGCDGFLAFYSTVPSSGLAPSSMRPRSTCVYSTRKKLKGNYCPRTTAENWQGASSPSP